MQLNTTPGPSAAALAETRATLRTTPTPEMMELWRKCNSRAVQDEIMIELGRRQREPQEATA